MEFSYWVSEAQEKGWIIYSIYQPNPFSIFPSRQIKVPKVLKTKTRVEVKTLLREHIYTADWFFKIHDDAPESLKEAFTRFFYEPDIYVDVKGDNAKMSKYGSQNHEKFSVDQKAVYYFYGIYVHKVIPKKLFKETWVPEKAAFIKGRKEKTRRKEYADCRLIGDFILNSR